MNQELTEKVNHHEWRLNQQEKSIIAMQAKQNHMSNTLDNILSAIKQIKVVAITVAIMLLMSEIGLIEVFKKFL